LNAGYKIAICEQLEKPTKGTKIVNRNVVRVITAGTVIEENLLDEKDNNYLMCIIPNTKTRGIAISVVDISTGEIRATFLDGNVSEKFEKIESKLKIEISKYSPKEIIISEINSQDKNFAKIIKDFGASVSLVKPENISQDFKIVFANTDASFKLIEKLGKFVEPAIYAILSYVKKNYNDASSLLKDVQLYENNNFLNLSENTIRHLELVENFFTKSRKYSLLDILDKTKTPMGARLLKKWLLEPLLDIEALKYRQEFVSFFVENYALTKDLREILAKINDMERIIGRINCNVNVPRDLIALKNLLNLLPEIKNFFVETCHGMSLRDIENPILTDIFTLLENAIMENPPNNIKDGNVIKNDFDERLDRLRLIKKNGKSILLDYENEEKERTKIPTLKIKFNNIFGYFFETTNLYKNSVPEDFIRIQTLSNCERFTTEKLKKYEIDLIQADAEAIELEQTIYNTVREKIQKHLKELQRVIFIISHLDVFANFGYIAVQNNFTKPELNTGYDIVIKNGRHPVIENIASFSNQNNFVPNDTEFIQDKCHFYLITGPNMAGKSTYIRQVALIVLMAQIGCFVPVDSATIGVVDKIFTRIGSGDKLVKGESTFLVEMKETVEIIKESTERSLVILDEVGRGTSTFDGISLAWVIANELVKREWMNKFLGKQEIGPKTLFATHYLELVELEQVHDVVQNFSLLVDDNHGEVIFLHKIVKGNSSKSYGIHVAKIAGLPIPLIEKAKNKLKELEQITKQEFLNDDENKMQFSFFEGNNLVIDELKNLNTDELSPVGALLKIKEWQEKI
jgi:DNA mismatch repair protein MutS